MSYTYSLNQIRRKLYFINLKGRLCNDCGRNLYETPWLADFHHKDPTQKDFTIASESFSPRTLNKLTEEVNKCEILCCECHRNKHFNNERFIKFKKEIYENIDEAFKDERYFVTDEDKHQILKLHHEGLNPGKISVTLFNNKNLRHTVTRVIKNAGFKPNSPKSLIDAVNRDAIIQMLKEKKTVKQIATHYGMCKGNMFILLNELNITEHRTNGYRKNIKSSLTKEKLQELLITKSVREIANEYGCKSVNPVYRLIKQYELKNPDAF
jgi:hypothetical protein